MLALRARVNHTIVVGIVLVLGVAGCGPKLEYADVEGKVTLNGKPLEGVNVVFYPESEGREQLPYATGTTDAAGVYTLATSAEKPGAIVGKHRVVVSWPVPERPADVDRPPPPLPGPPIPLRYTVANDTPLIVEVKAGGPQTIDLPLVK